MPNTYGDRGERFLQGQKATTPYSGSPGTTTCSRGRQDVLDGGSGNDFLDGGAVRGHVCFRPRYGQDTIVASAVDAGGCSAPALLADGDVSRTHRLSQPGKALLSRAARRAAVNGDPGHSFNWRGNPLADGASGPGDDPAQARVEHDTIVARSFPTLAAASRRHPDRPATGATSSTAFRQRLTWTAARAPIPTFSARGDAGHDNPYRR